MKTEKLDGGLDNMWGKKLPKTVSYVGSFEAYETFAEIVAAKDEPSNEEIVSFRNGQRRANQRQKLMADALDVAAKQWTAEGNTGENPYVKPTIASSPDMRFKVIYDALIAAGKSEAEATETAKAALA